MKGKVAVITGGATGICYVIAEAYLRFGASVCIMSRKQKAIDSAVENLKKTVQGSQVYG